MDSKSTRILVVDDASDTLEVLERNLKSRGYLVSTAKSAGEATHKLDTAPIDLVITDFKMPQVSGLDLVQYVRENFRDTEIIMITGYPSIDGAVQAVKMGACDYLEKPFTDEELFTAVEQALERLQERRSAREQIPRRWEGYRGIIAESVAMQQVFAAIDRAATTMANVLITGESGTGKELIARAIHYKSNRAASPFVPVNCGGIPESLLESELFGHVKGAFTGATRTRSGFFQVADGGTIFLDEIGETSTAMQVKLLRVVENKEFSLIGDSERRRVDVRIVAATNKNLRGMIEKGTFRDDLFFRLSVVTIAVPALRDRENDIVLLANAFARKHAEELDRPPISFSNGAVRVFKQYHWPGNVREVQNVVQQLTIMSDHGEIRAADLPSLMKSPAAARTTVNRTLAAMEREHIENVLASVNGNKTRAAEILGIDRKTLREKLKNPSESP